MALTASFADNLTRPLLGVLAPKIADARELKFAVAFVSHSGLTLIQNSLERCLANGGSAEFLIGLDFQNTEAEALKTLITMREQGLPIACYCFLGQRTTASVYHPKLYIINDGSEVTAVVGSSNLTQGGLKGNLEINAVFEADPSEELISDLYGAYNRLKFQPNHFAPDTDFVSLYEKLQRETSKRAREAEVATTPLMRLFRDKVASLPHPIATAANLFGWQKIVYERLPSGIFRTSDLYVFEREFRQFHTQNQNIRAKVRQILQQLRDLGLLQHLATNQWRRRL